MSELTAESSAAIQLLQSEIDERRRAEDELRRAKQFSESVIQSSIDGILAFDTRFCYTAWNAAMERISGVPAGQVLGKYAFDVFPFLLETGEDQYFRAALAGQR